MSKEAVEQRPITDIYYDYNPFITDKQVRYIQADQKLAGPRDFSTIPKGYYDLLWDGLLNDVYFRQSIQNSTFLHSYMDEIINRFCHECGYITEIEKDPINHGDITKEEVLPYIINWFDYAIETCRYGELNERMIDTVERDDIDTFLEEIVDFCAERLVIYVINSNN